MNISPISLNSQIRLRSLSKQLENGVAIIGWGNEFLELPAEGLEFLAWLDEGLSLAEARQRFEDRYNPFSEADVLEIMNAFVASDFIASVDGQVVSSPKTAVPSKIEWLPEKLAKALFSKPVLVFWLMIVVPAIILWVKTPSLWPRSQDYFFVEYNFIIILVGLLIWLIDMPLHEMSHLLACRAKGIDATITWTQRLGFIPMSQTVMHNIWAVPRTTRLLPLAAGMVLDILRISFLIYLLYFQVHGGLVLPILLIKFLKFYLLIATLSLTSQFWLFSQMDGYFLLSSLLGQRNLQADTYHWLKFALATDLQSVAHIKAICNRQANYKFAKYPLRIANP